MQKSESQKSGYLCHETYRKQIVLSSAQDGVNVLHKKWGNIAQDSQLSLQWSVLYREGDSDVVLVDMV